MTTPTDERITAAAIRLFVEKGTPRLTVSELAQEANVARGTLYRNIGSIDDLFARVLNNVSTDLHQRVSASFTGIDDPAARLATGVRLWIRYAHENPVMGHFAVRFGITEETLRGWLTGPPMADLSAGIAAGRYAIAPDETQSVASMVLGSTISAIWLVLEGHQTWREAGSSTAELILRALGIDAAEAHEICNSELPRLSAP